MIIKKPIETRGKPNRLEFLTNVSGLLRKIIGFFVLILQEWNKV